MLLSELYHNHNKLVENLTNAAATSQKNAQNSTDELTFDYIHLITDFMVKKGEELRSKGFYGHQKVDGYNIIDVARFINVEGKFKYTFGWWELRQIEVGFPDWRNGREKFSRWDGVDKFYRMPIDYVSVVMKNGKYIESDVQNCFSQHSDDADILSLEDLDSETLRRVYEVLVNYYSQEDFDRFVKHPVMYENLTATAATAQKETTEYADEAVIDYTHLLTNFMVSKGKKLSSYSWRAQWPLVDKHPKHVILYSDYGIDGDHWAVICLWNELKKFSTTFEEYDSGKVVKNPISCITYENFGDEKLLHVTAERDYTTNAPKDRDFSSLPRELQKEIYHFIVDNYSERDLEEFLSMNENLTTAAATNQNDSEPSLGIIRTMDDFLKLKEGSGLGIIIDKEWSCRIYGKDVKKFHLTYHPFNNTNQLEINFVVFINEENDFKWVDMYSRWKTVDGFTDKGCYFDSKNKVFTDCNIQKAIFKTLTIEDAILLLRKMKQFQTLTEKYFPSTKRPMVQSSAIKKRFDKLVQELNNGLNENLTATAATNHSDIETEADDMTLDYTALVKKFMIDKGRLVRHIDSDRQDVAADRKYHIILFDEYDAHEYVYSCVWDELRQYKTVFSPRSRHSWLRKEKETAITQIFVECDDTDENSVLYVGQPSVSYKEVEFSTLPVETQKGIYNILINKYSDNDLNKFLNYAN